jgi:hypothetical protein
VDALGYGHGGKRAAFDELADLLHGIVAGRDAPEQTGASAR